MRNYCKEISTLYLTPKMGVILILGIISGLPLALTASTLSVWLTEENISLATIGIFGLVGLPYSIKFLWAPIMDSVKIPILHRLGRRRSWLLLSQILVLLVTLLLAYSNPTHRLELTAIAALLLAVFSTCQDIVIDAYRVESLNTEQQGAAATMYVLGYRVGMLISGAGALFLAEHISWPQVYASMGMVSVMGIALTLLINEPSILSEKSEKEKTESFLVRAVLCPLRDLWNRPYFKLMLVFVVCYKLGDAFAGMMTNPFLLQIGFSKSEIATWAKTFGFGATVFGIFIGGIMVKHFAMAKLLLLGSVIQMLSNSVFVIQAFVGYHVPLLAAAMATENAAAGIGTAVFVAFLSRLCAREYTATQYALLSAIALLGRTTLSAVSGFLVEWLGWPNFFVFSMALAIPGIALIALFPQKILRALPGK